MGIGGAKLLELIEWEPELYHLNESHAISLACYLYSRYRSIEAVRQKLVFTNHTPEPGGNQQTDIYLLEKMGFLYDLSANELKDIAAITNSVLDHTVFALKMSSRTNSVSVLHNQTLLKTYRGIPGCSAIINITNAQNFAYWADKEMYTALNTNNDEALQKRKKICKQQLFEEVADQDGEIYDEDILTIVFAKRFAGYKRAELLFHNMERFTRIVTNTTKPVQIIWAGKPYPVDYTAITVFDKIVNLCKAFPNCSVLPGYELKLSKLLKQGADIWMNVPRLTHEASGTSGMSAAMNGAVNLSIPDGWFPEFAKHGINSFVIPAADTLLAEHAIDDADAENLYNLLENIIIPMYYDDKSQWLSIIKNSMTDIIPRFDSNRMVDEYYKKLYAI